MNEIAKDLLNNNDATTIGVLLSFIVILLIANMIQWKKSLKDEEYIRSQDKANLEMLSTLAKNAELLGLDVNHIKKYTVDAKPKIEQVLEIIKNRLER